MKKTIEKLPFTACSKEVQAQVLANMKFVKWDEKTDGHRSRIIVTLKDGKFYGYGLI